MEQAPETLVKQDQTIEPAVDTSAASPATQSADAPVSPAQASPAQVSPVPEARAPSPPQQAEAPAAHASAGPEEDPPQAGSKQFDPIEALKLGSLRLANLIRAKPAPAAAASGDSTLDQPEAAASSPAGGGGEAPQVVARIRATAAGLSARAKEQGSRFYQASVKTAASTAEGIKRLALGEPLQALCRSECAVQPCPQLVLVCCTALVSGGGISTELIFKHNPPPELVDRLAAAAGSLSLLPPGASPHAVAALLKQFLLGLPEPLLTYRLLPQWVAAGDHPASCQALLPQLPAANAGTLKLLMQVCSHINAEAAQNEMDALALAEVLAPCMAWKPPVKPQGGPAGPGPWQGLARALTLTHKTAAGALTDPAAGEAAAVAAEEDDKLQQQQQQMEEAHRVTPLDEAELEAVVTVIEYMISNYNSVFGSSSGVSSGAAVTV